MEGKMTEEWRINRIGYATPYETHIFIRDAHGSPICGVWCPPGNEEQEANTLLLAAAPKMARALRAILPLVTCEDKGNDTRCPQEDMACYKCRFLADEARAALLAAGVKHE
jgi:hypothetical protein